MVDVIWVPIIERYDTYMAARGWAATTRKIRRQVAARMLALGPLPALDDDALAGWLADPSWTAQTRSSYRQHAVAFLSWANSAGLAPGTIGLGLPPVHVPPGSARPCPWPVVVSARRQATGRARAMISLGGYAGLRRAEIAGLSWLDLDADWLTVTGKGSRTRAVPAHPVVVADLAALPRWSQWVFPSSHRRGAHLSPHSVGQHVSRWLPDPWTCHNLRHAFATTAYAASRDLRAVQDLLGHASPATTARYVGVGRDRLLEVIGMLDAA